MAADPNPKVNCLYVRKIFDPKEPERVSYGLSPNDARANFLADFPDYEERKSIENLVIQLITWEDGQLVYGRHCQDGTTTTDFNMLWTLKTGWLHKLMGKNNDLAVAIEDAFSSLLWSKMGRLAEDAKLVLDPIPANKKYL